jgi:hypothetical protein
MKLLATAVLVLLTCVFAHAQQGRWEEFVSSEGGFSVLMPEKPTPNTMKVSTPKGERESRSFSYSDFGKTDYLVAFSKFRETDNKALDYDNLFDKIQKGLLIAQAGTVRSKIALTLDGNPGREVMIEHGDGSVKIHRFYFVGDYFYQLSVEIKHFESRDDQTDRFLNSFKLTAKNQ